MKSKSFVSFLLALMGLGLMAGDVLGSTATLTTGHSLTLTFNDNPGGTNRLWYAEINGAAGYYLIDSLEHYSGSQKVDTDESGLYPNLVSVEHSGTLLSNMSAQTSVANTPPTFSQNLEGKGLGPTYAEGSWRPGYTDEIAYNQLLVRFYGSGVINIVLSDAFTFTYGFNNTGGDPFNQVTFSSELYFKCDNLTPSIIFPFNFAPSDQAGQKSLGGTVPLTLSYDFGSQPDFHTLEIDLRSEFLGQTALPSGPPVPLPGTALLFGSGIFGLVAWRRFKKS